MCSRLKDRRMEVDFRYSQTSLRCLKYLAGVHEGRGVNDVSTFLENIIMDYKYQEEYLKSRINYDKVTRKRIKS